MKRIYFYLFSLLVFWANPMMAQRNCGQPIMMQHLHNTQPEVYQKILDLRDNIASKTKIDNTSFRYSSLLRTTSNIVIPVVFHFVIDSNTYKLLDSTKGIEERIASQMKVLNADYNGRNADKIKVPAVWSSLYANVGLGFGLAKKDPDGNPSLGYEIKIVPNGTNIDAFDGGKSIKFDSLSGIDAWDNTKYLNIWVGNLIYAGREVFGITVPPNYPGFTAAERGIVLNQFSIGSRSDISQFFSTNIDKGRTLTHEMGHYFYLWHTWGDDDGLCPGSGGADDGISDTPPEANAVFGFPIFPRFDACSPSGSGVMFMNYMDYVNDSAMYMFTKEQAIVMRSEFDSGGRSYSLSQHPDLVDDSLFNPPDISSISFYPNPTKGLLQLQYDSLLNELNAVKVVNVLGQIIWKSDKKNIKEIDLSGLPKGIYIVHCLFQKGLIPQKIIVE